MKPVKKLAVLLAMMLLVTMVFLAGCNNSGSNSGGNGEQTQPEKQKIDLSDKNVSYSTYLALNSSISDFTWRKKASISGMIDTYVGSAQFTIKVNSKDSDYQFENATLKISTLFKVGWDTETIVISLSDTGTAKKTVTIEYDFMSIPDMPDAESYLVSEVEGFVLV